MSFNLSIKNWEEMNSKPNINKPLIMFMILLGKFSRIVKFLLKKLKTF
jgi:hypothetical protein